MTVIRQPTVQQLRELLEQTIQLAGSQDRMRLTELASRLDERRLRVLVAGEAKRGKSTVVNALVGRDLLPTGPTPLTSVPTTVTAAGPDDEERVVIRFVDGTTTACPLSDVARYVTESGNPGNSAGVSEVRMQVHDDLLASHAVDIVDSPGTGSVFEANTREAEVALEELDAAVLVLTADPPISAAEKQLLQRVAATSTATFVLVNKADRLTTAELAEALAFTRQVCAESAGRDASVYSCSARDGREDAGFAAFAEALTTYLTERADTDVLRAIAGHFQRVVEAMRDDVLVRLRGLELTAAGQGRAADELRDRLVSIERSRGAIGDRCLGAVAGLRRDLDEGAAAAVPGAARACLDRLDEALAGSLAGEAVDQMEAQARHEVQDCITRRAQAWRTDASVRLQDGLTEVAAQVTADVRAQLELARRAVHDVLSLDVSLPMPDAVLAESTGFWLDFSPPVAWEPPLKSTLARLRSDAVRRRRAAARVRAAVRPLTDRQFGRVRADLQVRLEDGGRRLVHQLDEQFEHTIRRLLRAVAGLHDAEGDGAEPQREVLRRRARELEHVLADVEGLAGEARRPHPKEAS
jgi:GTPase Era involved in 16S rRNA processing